MNDEKETIEVSRLPAPAAWPPNSSEPSARQRRRLTTILLVALSIFLLYPLYQRNIFTYDSTSNPCRDDVSHSSLVGSNKTKVPLEAHIMSKCPDARDCLQNLVVPAMEHVSDKVDFRLSYIGSYSNSSDEVYCKHGPEECLGNMVLLCAAELYPAPIIHLGFANCVIGDYEKIPDQDLLKDCALEHGIDFDQVNACISKNDGGESVERLRQSFDRSANAGVQFSCTIRLDEEVRCIRDDGQWKNCKNGSDVEDLVKDVDVLYKKWNDE